LALCSVSNTEDIYRTLTAEAVNLVDHHDVDEAILDVGEEALEPPAFAQRIAELARQNPAAEVQLRADRSVPYGRVAELIGLVQQAGLSRIGLVAESAGEPAAR
jgi:biopolymer transport protein ExbD